ncbi:hypothetical protein NDU88_004109 [Pleurodeles waltl]|uniref:Uncharacterized protein n=1 Tax=Pleurodeles waltl TaxID=8319 RepID=A0AAV7W832_PLEWA|nr:hypothetical protein NDU88_004109 [Pleurodeles waltl]
MKGEYYEETLFLWSERDPGGTLESPAPILVVHGTGFYRIKGGGDRRKERREPGEVGAQWGRLQRDEETEEQDQCKEVLRA